MPGRLVNILLVEDDDVDAELVIRAFRHCRILNPVVRVKDGVEALQQLRGEDGRERLKDPYMLLVDLNMPRMDGLELIERIRSDQLLNKAVVFVLTTSRSEEDKLAAYNLNVAGYLVKSRVGDDFVGMVRLLDHYWSIVEFP